jgi:hypothetical protein
MLFHMGLKKYNVFKPDLRGAFGLSHYKTILLTAAGITVCGSAFAYPSADPGCFRKGFQENVSNIRKVGLMGNRRQTLVELAVGSKAKLKMLNNKYRASGYINCKGTIASAQLTGDNRTVTTAGHLFAFDDCTGRDPQDCYYVDYDGKKVTTYKFQPGSLKKGEICSNNPDDNRDWAVLRLEKPIENVTAYKVPADPFPYGSGQKVAVLSGYMKDMKIDLRHPGKIYQECTMAAIDLSSIRPIRSDCSSIGGASGSGYLIEQSDGIYLAATMISGPDGSGAFDLNSFYDDASPVAGDFRRAILDSMAGK